MSDATLKILFEDNGDDVPAQSPPQPAPPDSKRPASDTVTASDTNPNGIESPYPAAPERSERTVVPSKEDAKKGIDEFFEVLKESGERLADVAGVGRIYSTIAELLAGVSAVISAFRVKAEKSAIEATPPRETTNGPTRLENGESRAAPFIRPVIAETLPDKDAKNDIIDEEEFLDSLEITRQGRDEQPLEKLPDIVERPSQEDLYREKSRQQEHEDFGIEHIRRESPISNELVKAERSATAIPTATALPEVAPATATALPEVAGAVGGFSAALGPASAAVIGLTATVAAGAISMKLAFDAIKSQVELLEGFSGDVALAGAQSDLRQEFAIMRRAEQLGPDLASFETARGKIDEKLTELQTEILRILLNAYKVIEPLAPAAEAGIVIATAIAEGVAELVKKAQNSGDAAIAALGAISPTLSALLGVAKLSGITSQNILDALRKDDFDLSNDPFMAQWAALSAPGMPRFNPTGRPAPGTEGNRNRAPNLPPGGRRRRNV